MANPILQKLKVSNLNEAITKYSDLVLAAVVIIVLGLIFIPLPTWLNDLLISLDIAVSILILLVALYISDALKIASFPTILLITTIYRLSLNIASTRLILDKGEAGAVIHAVGDFVIGGKPVVGGVLFL